MARSKPYQLTKKKFLSNEEKEAIFKTLEAAPLREWLLIRLAIHTGARAQEILNIRPEDLDLDEIGVQIYGLKGSRDRFLPLPSVVMEKLAEYCRDMPHNEPIFNMTYRWFLMLWYQYAPPGKGIHSARHSFAIELYRRTKDLMLVKSALGHININNTTIYADYERTRSEIREAMGDEYR